MTCKDCRFCRSEGTFCSKCIPMGQLNCPEFESIIDKDHMTVNECTDCAYFDMCNHKPYCRRYNASISTTLACRYFSVKFEPPTHLKDIGKVYGTSIGAVNLGIQNTAKWYEDMMRKNELEKKQFINTFTVDDGIRTREELKDLADYCKRDVDALDALVYGKWNNTRKEYNKMFKMDKVKKVIFNPPATIVYWFDGTKTIVKVQDGEIFDKEKGFAMACAKKFFGNKGNYYNEFRKHGADNHCYSVHIDLAHPGEVVKSSIGDGISYDGAGSVSMSPNKIREMVGFPPISDIHEAAMPSVIREELEKSELDEKPVGSMLDISHRARIQKKKEYIDDVALKAAVDCRLNVEVVESNDGDVEYVFSFMHDDNKYKRKHCIGHDEFDVYSQEYLGNRLECRIGVWLGELAKAGIEPVKKESE